MSGDSKHRFATRAIHAGAAPDLTTVLMERLLISLWHLYLTGAGHAAALFGLEETELIYSRLTNSTVGVFQHRIASLEGGVGGPVRQLGY